MEDNHAEVKAIEAENMKLPKNIRQMGMPGEKQKIYIEDYVYTYLHSFLKEKQKEEPLKVAVVLGEYHKKDGCTYAFLKGAIACDFSQFQGELSKELKLTIRNYFPGWDILGWYVSSQGVDAHVQSEVKHRYASKRATLPQYLIYEDELERDIQVFSWEQNALHYLNGYYIYYERNPRMQEFMIMEKGGQSQEVVSVSYKENVSKCFGEMREHLCEEPQTSKGNRAHREESHQERQQKKRMAQGKSKKPQRIIYAACAAILVVLVAMGVTQMGNYQNLKQLQEAISNNVIPVWKDKESIEPIEENESIEDTESVEDVISQSSAQNKESQTSVQNTESPASSQTTEVQLSEQTIELQTPAQNDEADAPEYYVVKKGDSLYSISRALYENEDMVGPLCDLNEITNLHLIFEGQTLKLP